MMNPPGGPEPYTRRAGQRGETTETYARMAQRKADRGEEVGGAAGEEKSGGLLAFLAKLWPFRRGG